MITRAKFYITSINSNYSGSSTWHTVNFNACFSKDNSSENYIYWKSSPNGNMKIYIDDDIFKQSEFEIGSYWYIDIEKQEIQEENKDSWRLSLMSKPSKDSLGVRLEKYFDWKSGWGQCTFEITIDNKNAWPTFVNLEDLYTIKWIKTIK